MTCRISSRSTVIGIWRDGLGTFGSSGLSSHSSSSSWVRRSSTCSASARSPPRARPNGTTLKLITPHALRLGLIFQTRVDIVTVRAIHTPILVFGSGWFDGATLNSSEPSAVAENHRGDMSRLFTHRSGVVAT